MNNGNEASQHGTEVQLAALTARFQGLEDAFKSFKSDVGSGMEDIKSGIADMSRRFEGAISDLRQEEKGEVEGMRTDYVTKAEFEPYKQVVSKGVLAILAAVLAAVLALVVRSH